MERNSPHLQFDVSSSAFLIHSANTNGAARLLQSLSSGTADTAANEADHVFIRLILCKEETLKRGAQSSHKTVSFLASKIVPPPEIMILLFVSVLAQ